MGLGIFTNIFPAPKDANPDSLQTTSEKDVWALMFFPLGDGKYFPRQHGGERTESFFGKADHSPSDPKMCPPPPLKTRRAPCKDLRDEDVIRQRNSSSCKFCLVTRHSGKFPSMLWELRSNLHYPYEYAWVPRCPLNFLAPLLQNWQNNVNISEPGILIRKLVSSRGFRSISPVIDE